MPAGVAACIRVESALAGVDVDSLRFPKVRGVYQSPNYDTVTNKVEVEVSAAVGSVSTIADHLGVEKETLIAALFGKLE